MTNRHKNLDLNDKWTALAPLCGWRHFRITMRRYDDLTLMIELMAACDPSARVWVRADELKDEARFKSGWIRGLGSKDDSST